MVGKNLSHYRVLEKLGAGGMGEVYLAEDTTLKRQVALKILPPELIADRELLERLRREAEVLAGFDHPNIVQIHTIEEDQGTCFLTMELVRGKTLSRIIPRSGLPAARFFEIAIPLADALAVAHRKGVIHRDLKPGNVMVTDDGRVKVLDFGLAKQIRMVNGHPSDSEAPTLVLATEPGTVLGTVGYMSPEQVRGKPLDSRSDVFSLGAVLYEMATGRRAFAAESGPDTLSAILRDTPSPLDIERPDLPRHLGRIVRRCLEKSPDRRFPSGGEVRNELEDLAREIDEERVLSERDRSTLEAPDGRRRPRLVITLAAAAILVVGLLLMQWVRRGLETPPAVESASQAKAPIDSLAVLPFDNLMNDPEQDYFVAGMHEALITDLAQIGALRVISRTSTIAYRETDKSLPQIASELGVDAIVEGSVLRADGQVRITAQLIEGPTDHHLWAQSYDRELEDVLALLSDVAQAIAAEIEIVMAPELGERLDTSGSVDPEAYELYLKGRHFFNQGSIDGFRQAFVLLQQVVEIAPDFAAGWASLSGAYVATAFFSLEPPAETVPKARAVADRALQLDPNLADAHASLGAIALYFDWNWATARRELEKALELDPTATMVYHSYADYLAVMGDCAVRPSFFAVSRPAGVFITIP